MAQELPCVAEAVKSPAALILPHEADHVTALFAVNCCVCPCAVTALAGVMVIGELMLAVVVPLAPLPLLAVAVITHDPGVRGAVKSPADVIVPHETVKVEAVLAVNCCVAPSLTTGFCGLTVTVVLVGAVIVS